MVPPEIIDRVRDSVPLADYIGKDVKLTRSGSNFKGLCPFHNEKTPSFVIYTQDNRYHCFGCGEHGDIYRYMKEKEGISFIDAVEKLAKSLGIEIPRENNNNSAAAEYNKKILNLNNHSLEIFRYNLKVFPPGKKAMKYLTGRGLTLETIDYFKLGYALSGWDNLVKRLVQEKFQEKTIIASGLARNKEKTSRIYDYFRDRVIFPIYNERNDVVAFGGRVMDDGGPKYLNSPETPVFQKRFNLYGLNFSKTSISKNNVAWIVEGYLDVIGLAQAGYPVAVAPLGTSLTENHLKSLKKYAKRLVFLFDGDTAGRKAVFKSARTALDIGFESKVVLLPDNTDAFDLSISSSKKEINSMIKKGIPLIDFVLNHIYKDTDTSSIEGKLLFLQKVYDFLMDYDNHSSASLIIKKAAILCGVDPEEALADYKNFRDQTIKNKFQKVPIITKFETKDQNNRKDSFDFYLMRLLCFNSELWGKLNSELNTGLMIEDSRAVYLMSVLKSFYKQKGNWTVDDVLKQINQPLISDILIKEKSTGNYNKEFEKQFEDAVQRLRINSCRRKRIFMFQELQKLKITGDTEEIKKMQKSILSLRREEEALLHKPHQE